MQVHRVVEKVDHNGYTVYSVWLRDPDGRNPIHRDYKLDGDTLRSAGMGWGGTDPDPDLITSAMFVADEYITSSTGLDVVHRSKSSSFPTGETADWYGVNGRKRSHLVRGYDDHHDAVCGFSPHSGVGVRLDEPEEAEGHEDLKPLCGNCRSKVGLA